MADWIKCSERLPMQRDIEVSVDVLVFADGVRYQASVEFESGYWYDSDGDPVYDVTHWQYLTPPPEQE